ncbi:MAG: DUF1003 domain-containing protein [Armatimonadetes bacterium]|nr:DUF1003 domain-containing protein [Armatimonadota bacterium]
MATTKIETVKCQVCGQQKQPGEVIAGGAVREGIVELIKADHPDWSPAGFICIHDLDEYRMQYVKQSLEADKGELTELESEVIRKIGEKESVAKNLNKEFDTVTTTGERVADKVAEFGGSWKFIIGFGVVLVLWITVNSIALLRRPFDPFPFILLNLVLSCLAAIQAPIIMMSQNRQEAKDRLRSEHDYQVNLKAELEIRALSEKMDHLLHTQWQRLLEIQQIQTDLMEELNSHMASNGK